LSRAQQENIWPLRGFPIPHFPNIKGFTPLHIAEQLQQRKVVPHILELLGEYPLDFCTAEIVDVLP